MAEYKCICCGEIVDKQEITGCHICGYKMFKLPYNRRDTLINEIRSFIKHTQNFDIRENDVLFLRDEQNDSSDKNTVKTVAKKDDLNRFPNFQKISNYICSEEKTEKFIERMKESLRQIKKFTNASFNEVYYSDYSSLYAKCENSEFLLRDAFTILGIEAKFDDASFPECILNYSEIPNQDIVCCSNKLLEICELIVEKLYKFIKLNNIYGMKNFKCQTNGIKINFDFADEYKKCISKAEKILNKNYVVDLFSDGSDEIGEMLSILWKSISLVLKSPFAVSESTFNAKGMEALSESDYYELLRNTVRSRYAKNNEDIFSYNFLADKTDDEIFDLYNKLIEIDLTGFFGVNKKDLMNPGKNEVKLESLIGLSEIKESIKKIKAYAIANKNSKSVNLHMCFYGNPGTGKTEVARIIAGILYENDILPTKNVVEVDRSGLVGRYVGETPQKTMAKIEEAMGGVLFIDEAYALIPKEGGGWDYGHEAVATLIKAMEDYRGKFCVILAGYKNETINLLESNPGFKSRIQFELDFPNYSRDELRKIAELMVVQREYSIEEAALEKLLDITDIKRKESNFANAREIRNILDQVIMCQNLRCLGTSDKRIAHADVAKYIIDSKINLPTKGESFRKTVLTGEEELDKLIGLAPIKRMIKKIKAYAKRNSDETDFNIHMCFYGNPGTGKTEVARILSRILYDAGTLSEAKVVETDAHGLIGRYVGETAPKTLAKIREAMGGVLFIDEAYGLTDSVNADGTSTGYGEEAIAVLLKEMEDHRGQFCTILAGYQNEMKNMISSNPGLESRIQFTLNFPDYTREELEQIILFFADKKKYSIESDAMKLILDLTDYYRNRPNFANARTARNILDQVIMNQNLRTEDTGDSNIILSDVEDYIADENIEMNSNSESAHRIGFV